VNEEALCEALTRDWGFEALWPETMSFEEQVRWFRDAEVVVGAQGSAMSNCVFCAPGTKIASICSGYAANFPAWAAALEAMGMRHCFLVGEGIENTHPIRLHWDLSLELRQIIEVLEELGVRRG
jgi:capsular polysaccharide biosynthesis protein